MRIIFTLYLTVVVGGLAYFVAVVLMMHRASPKSDQDQRMGAPVEPD